MSEYFKIGIRVSILDYATIGLRGISRAFLTAEGDAAKFEKRMKSITGQLKTGALMIGAGAAIAYSLKPAVDKAIELEQAINRLKALNLGTGTTGALMASAQTISRSVKGTSIMDAVRLVTETQSITANAEHTQMLAPLLAKMRFGMNVYGASHGLGEGSGEAADSQFQAVVKTMEMRGLMRNFTAQNAEGLANLFTKAFVASGGMVKPTDFLAMMKTAGVAGKQLSPDFMLAMGHVMQEMGGSRSGTALMSAYNNWQNGRTTQMSAEELARVGLVKSGHIKPSSTGKMMGIKPDALINSDTYMSNPLQYMNQYLLPALKAHGIDPENQRQVLSEISTLFSNRTAGALFSQMYLDRTQLSNYMGQTKGVFGVDQLAAQAGKSTVGNVADLQAKFNTLLATLGTTVLPVLNRVLELIIPKLQAFSDFAQAHPRMFAALTNGLIGLAGALVLFGSLNIVVGGIRGIGLAFSLLKAAQLPAIAAQITGVSTSLGLLGKASILFLTGLAAYAAGTQISHALDRASSKYTNGQEQTWGGYLYDRYHPFNSQSGKRELSIWKGMWSTDQDVMQSNQLEGNALRSTPGAKTPIQMQTTIQLDSRTIAKAVTTHQVNQAAAPQSGTSSWDSSMMPSPVGLNTGY